MPHALHPHESERIRLALGRLKLNTDGRRHPFENTLSLVALACGVVAIVSGLIVSAHMVASWAGATGFLLGMYSQYVSATTPERSLNILAIVMSFVGVATGIYHGGFIP
ncbi:hypothetical protein [Sphaerisporangium fuscum]|uniref:hypothetical protein n=1 Tax=Sphaerisporangium fuscum TaxID=2835868 RepID=UPI001BDC3649|nr:hypothetical protein [Sphaerisporangium fuscum]